MINVRLYSPENVDRAKYAQVGMLIVAVVVCGFFTFSAISSVNEIWRAQKALDSQKKDLVALTRREAELQKQEAGLPPPSNGGVEQFAVFFANWANERGLYIDSVVPEGTPTDSEIKVDDTELGKWRASKVRVQGKGQFSDLVELLDRFREPEIPITVDSFSLRSSQEDETAVVGFELLLTVYGKKRGDS